MQHDHMKVIEDIIDGIKCPKDFECYKKGFENLCKAKDFGLSDFLECLEKNPGECKFSGLMGPGIYVNVLSVFTLLKN